MDGSIERRKLVIDLYKHIATLSVGCLAVIIAFLPQLGELTEAKGLIAWSVVAFLVAVGGSVISIINLLRDFEKPVKFIDGNPKFHYRLAHFFSLGGWGTGLALLGSAVFSNL